MDVKRQNGNEFTEETWHKARFLDFYYTTHLATAQVTGRGILNENSKTGIIYFKIVSFNFVLQKMLILRTIQLQPRHYSPNPNDMKTTKTLLRTIMVAAMASCSNNEPDNPTIGRDDINEMAMTYACSDKVRKEKVARIAERFSAKGDDLRT